MNKVKYNGTLIRDCMGYGRMSLLDVVVSMEASGNLVDARFFVSSSDPESDDYVLSLCAGGVLISTTLNSDHILIMKQILKEMGEI